MDREKRNEIARRRFLTTMAALGLPIATPVAVSARPARRVPADFPRNDPARVQAVVGASHGNLDAVRELVIAQPALAKAAWDWGFGDWETALGAASHTGRRTIAEFLIGNGAHPTVFSAAMLGDVDSVRMLLAADPSLFRQPGPHGLSLIHHARAGGDDAQRVVDHLLDRFGEADEPLGVTGDAAVEARYGGRYRFEDVDPAIEIGVAVRNDWLLVGAGEQPNSRVHQIDVDVFHPLGAPAVQLRFDVVDGRTRSLTIVDGPLTVTGART